MAKGKTEAFWLFRGKQQAKYKRKLDALKSEIPIPNSDLRLRVVDECIRLGSLISAMGSPGADLERRVGTALGAYVSCVTMLGAACLQRKARISLCASLVFSRLLFNVIQILEKSADPPCWASQRL